MYHWHAKNLRDGFGAFQRRLLYVVVSEAVVQAMPNQILKGQRLVEFDLLMPTSLALDDIGVSLHTAHNVVIRIQDFNRQLAISRTRSAVGKTDVKNALGVGCAGGEFTARRMNRVIGKKRPDSYRDSETKEAQPGLTFLSICVFHWASAKAIRSPRQLLLLVEERPRCPVLRRSSRTAVSA